MPPLIASLPVVLGAVAVLIASLGAALVLQRRVALLRADVVHGELLAKVALENTQQGAWDFDVITGRVTVDEGFRRIVGEPKVNPNQEETWQDSIHPDDAVMVRGKLQQHLASGDDLYETRFRAKSVDGTWKWLNSRGRVVQRAPDGRALRMVGTIRDITDQQLARARLLKAEDDLRAAQKLEAVGRLAGGIAHHLNNTMMVVIGRADLLMMDSLEPRQVASVKSMKDAAERAATLCRNLLAYGRRQILLPAAVDINALIAGMEPSLRATLGPGIRLESRLEPAIQQCVVDAEQIEWVIRQLVDNARDAVSNDGVVRITTATAMLSDLDAPAIGASPGPYVTIAIGDTGPGIDAATMPHIFEPFFTTKVVGEGNGLGLATCYGVIKQSGGHLRVESEPGAGATFTVLLPVSLN